MLENLAKKDETVVREQAAASLTAICNDMSPGDIQNHFSPLLSRLASADWFTGRVSACTLFYHAYPEAGAQKDKLRKKFIELCQEDTPMIRRVCAAKLGEFATRLEKQHVIQELLPTFRQLSQDDQDSCRVLCIESLIPMARYLSNEENRVHTLGSLLNAGEDKSWKVRLCFARNFAKFAEAFGHDITNNNLIQTFNLLLTDCEPEVKNAAITSLTQSFEFLSAEKICNILLPTLQSTYADAQVSFKAGTALALCEMASRVGKSFTQQKILPILLELLNDEGSSEVRLNVAQNIGKLAPVVMEDLLNQALTSALTKLTKDNQWRVRTAIFELIGEMAVTFNFETFQSNLESTYFLYLSNNAASVRKMGIKKAGEIAETFKSRSAGNPGSEEEKWVETVLLKRVNETFNTEQIGFNFKMCALETISAVIPYLSQAVIAEHVVPTILAGCRYHIPNVKFCAARIIKANKRHFDQ